MRAQAEVCVCGGLLWVLLIYRFTTPTYVFCVLSVLGWAGSWEQKGQMELDVMQPRGLRLMGGGSPKGPKQRSSHATANRARGRS